MISEHLFADEAVTKTIVSHPASKLCARFCSGVFEKYQQHSVTEHVVIHICHLLSKCLPYFGASDFKLSCENLLTFLAFNQKHRQQAAFVQTAVFNCFLTTLNCSPLDQIMNAETNEKLILAFYDFEPDKKDLESYVQWCGLQFEAHK